jgi:YVTN family beta-propeller protein
VRAPAAALLTLFLASAASAYPDSLVAAVDLGGASGPADVCVSPDGGHLYATVEFGLVYSVETAGYTKDGSCYIGSELGAVCTSPDGGHVYACNVEENALEVVDPASMQHLATVEVGAEPAAVAAGPNGERVFVSCGMLEVLVVATATWTVEESVPVGGAPRGICIMAGDSVALVAREESYDAALLDLENLGAEDMFVGADTRDVCALGEGTEACLTVPGWDMVKQVDVSTGEEVADVFGVGDQPGHVCALPSGSHAYVSTAEGMVTVIDAATHSVVDSVAVGGEPAGICADPSGAAVYVADNASGEVLVIGGGASGTYGGDATGPVLTPAGGNPCAGSASLLLRLAEAAPVTLRLYDSAGRLCGTRSPGPLPAGSRKLDMALPGPGVYVCVAEAGGRRASTRLVSLGE